jgi:maltoporin
MVGIESQRIAFKKTPWRQAPLHLHSMFYRSSLPSKCSLRIAFVALVSFSVAAPLFADDAAEIAALKAKIDEIEKRHETDMNQMRYQYEQRIEALDSKVSSLETKSANAGNSILNAHVLTDADGKTGVQVLDDSFLKTLTRNFTFSAYIRAGIGFNGNGGAQSFNFTPPDNFIQGGRSRLGNENDTYFELTWRQAHMLGDSPDAMDVSMQFTPAIQFSDSKNNFQSIGGRHSGIFWEEAYVEAQNIFKSAPEVAFWAGQRFYERFNVDPMDIWFINPSGYGAGVENIDLGIGKLNIAYLGGSEDMVGNDQFNSQSVGAFYKHTLDIRLKDIDFLGGKLALIAEANYIKGGAFDVSSSNGGGFTGTLHTGDAAGAGGGFIWRYDFGNKSFLLLSGLYGYGATNFRADMPLSDLDRAFNSAVTQFNAFGSSKSVKANGSGGFDVFASPISRQQFVQATAFFVWNPTDRFSVGIWAMYQNQSQGFRSFGTGGLGTNAEGDQMFRDAAATRNIYNVGIRPIFWITDDFAIQAQAAGYYMDNDRGYVDTNSFGRSGSMGVFTIAPTIKPKGGYFTRPEIRLFATYSIWSDSLKGATTPTDEGQNLGPSNTVYGNSNQGWLFGTQVEWSL